MCPVTCYKLFSCAGGFSPAECLAWGLPPAAGVATGRPGFIPQSSTFTFLTPSFAPDSVCVCCSGSFCLPVLSVFQPPCIKGEDAPVYGEGDLGPICLDHQPVQCCKPVNSYSSSLFSSCGVQMDHKKTGKSLSVPGGRVLVTLSRSL